MKSEKKSARRWLLATRILATLAYVGGTVWFTVGYLSAAQLLVQTDASPRAGWTMLVGDCTEQTAHSCASGLADYSLAVAVGFAGVAAAVLPAIWFVTKRWELVSVLVAALGGLLGLVAADNATSKLMQLGLVLFTLAFSVLVNFAGRAIERLKVRAAQVVDEGTASQRRWAEMQESQAAFEERIDNLSVWRAFRTLRRPKAIPLGILVFALPILGSVALIVAFFYNL